MVLGAGRDEQGGARGHPRAFAGADERARSRNHEIGLVARMRRLRIVAGGRVELDDEATAFEGLHEALAVGPARGPRSGQLLEQLGDGRLQHARGRLYGKRLRLSRSIPTGVLLSAIALLTATILGFEADQFAPFLVGATVLAPAVRDALEAAAAGNHAAARERQLRRIL